MIEEKDLDEYYELAQGLIDFYADRNKLFAHMEDMFYTRWDMPAGMPDWVIKVISTDPHDAILTAVRTFATVQPRFKIAPMLNNEANRDRANQIETALGYNFHQASRRNDASVVWDVIMSASLYGEVSAQAVYLPYQEKVLKAMGKDTKRIEASKRFGDFAFIVHNPANVYPEWSEYGLEGVLTVRVQTADEFMDTWGELAKPLMSEQDYQEGRVTYVTSFDYINYEKRCVWGVCNDTSQIRITGTGIKILEEENKLGFIPYAIRRWGNSLSVDPREKVMPLLASVWDSGQWDMLNVFESMDSSLAMKRAAQPQFAGEFPPGQEPELDNTEPVGVTRLPAGTRNFTPLPAQSADGRVEAQKQQFRSGIWASSVARVLTTLETGNRESYSSFNQRLTAASNSLAPYKILSENALSELAHQMLCWIKYYGKEYGKVDLYGQYNDKTRLGQEVRIASDTIEPDVLKIEVALTADMPVDRLQQINGAVLLKNNFKVPEAELLEDIMGGDPAEMAKRRNLEDYLNTYIELDRKRMEQELQLEGQQRTMEMQAGLQQQQQQQQAQQESQAMQQEQMMRQQESTNADAANNASPAQQAMGGNSPNMGGQPPVQMARGQR
jgi:hypothetical protein